MSDAPGVVWQAGGPLAPGRGGIVGMHADGPEAMRELLITCKRGTFRWAMGQDIGSIADLDAAVGHVVDAVEGCPP
ncbi:hypothetical protein [Actinomadura macra]|uniref:hypothetical protein n=1 Tax=Actinomadura macra TaxID=46164 RepID=UPI000832233F|nr:hypothetical protein [Actinomadura macra]